MKFDSIIFDVDGTIWNTTPVVAAAWNIAIENFSKNLNSVTPEILKGQFGKTMDVIAKNLFPELNINEQKKLIDSCCIEEHIAIENCYDDLTYSGVSQGFKLLSEKYPLFIVSNCQSGYIEIVMEKTGIKSYVKDFECYGNTGKNKDQNIRLLIERNGLKNPVYVGDTQGDYDACNKANIPFIWASYGFGKPDDDKYFAKIENFTDLLDLLN